MRRRKSAPHGFAVNDNNLNFDKVILLCRICCPLPRQFGNHTGRLAVYKPFTGSLRVLLITTQSRPTHLTCGRTILRIMIPRSRSWQKGELLPLSGQKVSLETNIMACHGAFSVSLAQAGTYLHGWYVFFKLQINGSLFSVHPIALKKGSSVTTNLKNQNFF